MIDINELESRLKKAQSRAEKAKAAFEAATTEAGRLETALSVVREMLGTTAGVTAGNGSLTTKQQIVINSLKFGQNNAMSPVDIYQTARRDIAFDGDVNYVRTTLWRMADKGNIGSSNGVYWRFEESPQIQTAPSPPSDSDPSFVEDLGLVSRSSPWDSDLDDSDSPF